VASSRSLMVGVQPGSRYSRPKRSDEWTLKSLPLMTMML
jgi:hypothetical protein